MSKRDKRQTPRIIKIHNSFQLPGTELPIDNDLASKWTREEIVRKFLEERDRHAKG
jgi:hypothetical protein